MKVVQYWLYKNITLPSIVDIGKSHFLLDIFTNLLDIFFECTSIAKILSS